METSIERLSRAIDVARVRAKNTPEAVKRLTAEIEKRRGRDTLSNIEATRRMDAEADERDLADFIDRNKAAKRASDNRSVEWGE